MSIIYISYKIAQSVANTKFQTIVEKYYCYSSVFHGWLPNAYKNYFTDPSQAIYLTYLINYMPA